jgi:two-component system chemotaxis sensor kinase CheA
VISLLSIVETVHVKAEQIKTVSGSGEVYLLRERYIPVARAAGQFGVQQKPEDKPADLLVIVETENIRFGILVNELLEQQQIVIKSIEKNYKKVDGLTGATILGDGRVALILDIPGLLQNLRNNGAVTQEEQDFAVAA